MPKLETDLYCYFYLLKGELPFIVHLINAVLRFQVVPVTSIHQYTVLQMLRVAVQLVACASYS